MITFKSNSTNKAIDKLSLAMSRQQNVRRQIYLKRKDIIILFFVSSMMLSSILLIVLITMTHLTNHQTYSCNHNSSCGCSVKSRIDSKIVGGVSVTKHVWNWVVSIRVRNRHRCGGSIVSNSWILTAAHCFSIVNSLGVNIVQINASDITVHAGSIYQYEESQLRKVTDIILHPKFDELNKYTNDIAVLKLLSPFDMTDLTLAQICLPRMTLKTYPPLDSSVSKSFN
jgi:secreted trypsin-like serine protease